MEYLECNLLNRERCKIKRRGFTLIEILIVIAISVIILSISIPSMGELLFVFQLNSSLNQTVFELVKARDLAIQNYNGNEYISVYIDNNSIELINGNSINGTSIENIPLSYGVSITATPNFFYFSDITGNCSAQSNIKLTAVNKATDLISLNTLGAINVTYNYAQ